MVDRVTFSIPMPPSVNHLFAHVAAGRIKTKAYKDWLKLAGWEIIRQRVPSIAGRIEAHFWLPRPTETSDLDNRCKAIFDLMVAQRIIQDDRFVEKFTAEWVIADQCLVEVRQWVHPAVEADIEYYQNGVLSA